jgi:hypothetical protein
MALDTSIEYGPFLSKVWDPLPDYLASSLLGRESNGSQQNTGQRWPLTVL